jgi:o-succinylbenzoate synthase
MRPLHIRKPMAIQASYTKRTFHFSFHARTSRGTMKQRDSWFLKIWDTANPEIFGIGEAAPVQGLSSERSGDVHDQMEAVIQRIHDKENLPTTGSLTAIHDSFSNMGLSSSVYVAVETAFLDFFNGGRRVVFENDFHKGKPLDINGLVWMGGLDFMLQ